jgi:hydroxymethylglutaryl-CoA lyase
MRQPKPDSVELIEVGPRDGFQAESTFIPTETKIKIIDRLAQTGLSHLQVTSFVNPRKVPQMADAEAVVKGLPRRDQVCYSALVLNAVGVIRAAEAGLEWIEISISASAGHGLRNTGLTLAEARSEARKMIELAAGYGLQCRIGLQCVFGCVYDGHISTTHIQTLLTDLLGDTPNPCIKMVALADTTGMATPGQITRLIQKIRPLTRSLPIALHLHDTRGLGLVNLMAGLQAGVRHFDTSLAGMGGCPFITGAAGNIATEDSIYLLESLGISTHIDHRAVAACSRTLERLLEKKFPGKMYRLL